MPDRSTHHRLTPRYYRPWTEADDAILLGAPAGTSHRELGARLGRTTAAVTVRLTTLRRQVRGDG